MLQDIIFDSSEEEEEFQAVERRHKVYRGRINFTFLSDFECNERFRMSSCKLELLLQEIGPIIAHQSNKSGALDPKQQICIALHCLGTGAQYHSIGDMHGVSKATVCRCLHAVVSAVNDHLFNRVVSWPDNVPAEMNRFFMVAGFPNVCGVIDGSLINIDAPIRNEEAFVDRHGDHSLNCMFVCGASCMFYYVSARWPGSVNDARVLRNSTLFQVMETGNMFVNSVVLGDSAYPLRRWLMTPLNADPNNAAERRYNRRLKGTRQIIERALGILKEKFPCLNHLRLDPTFAGEVVKCCTTLCNFSRNDEENDVPHFDAENEEEEINDVDVEEDLLDEPAAETGRVRQQQILNTML